MTAAGLIQDIRYRVQLSLARLHRLWRLLVFGFEVLVLSRLFRRHRKVASAATAALLTTKLVEEMPPEVTARDDEGPLESWTHGFAAANAALFLNLRTPDRLALSRHAHPAPPFRAIYLWDSAFIAQVWKWWDPAVAWDVLQSVIDLRDGDRLQHFASEFAFSKFTQPPLVAWSLERLGDAVAPEAHLAWTEAAYDPLAAYSRWLYANRRLDNGLFAWAHPYESGVENAPRFSSRDERRLDDTRHLAAPDFCAYVVLQAEALAAMARRLGRAVEADQHARRAETLRRAANTLLWHGRDGLYYDRDVRDGRFVRSRTIASLLPLWAGIPDRDQARRLLDHILDPGEFNTLIPLPSVALDDPEFERDMWRGPVWVNTAYAVIEGLRRYGFHAAAADFAFRLCDGVYRTYQRTGRFYEFYDPTALHARQLQRKRGNRWKRVTLGSGPVTDFVGWTGLVNTLALEALFGVKQVQERLVMQPRFPPRAEGLVFSLALPRYNVGVELEVLPGGSSRGEIRTPHGDRDFSAGFGAAVMLTDASRAGAEEHA